MLWHVWVASVVSNSVIPWALTCQAPLSMGFSRQEYWSGLPCSISVQKVGRHKETLGVDEYINCLDCGAGFTGIWMCPASLNCVHQIYVVFLHINYTSVKMCFLKKNICTVKSEKYCIFYFILQGNIMKSNQPHKKFLITPFRK